MTPLVDLSLLLQSSPYPSLERLLLLRYLHEVVVCLLWFVFFSGG